MNTTALEAAIATRIAASMVTEGVTVQGVWSMIAPQGIEVKQGATPIILFALQSAENDDTFGANGFKADYRVTVFDSTSNTTTNLDSAYEAMIGNGTPTTSPTKGLHRWLPTVSSTNLTQMRMTALVKVVDGDALQYSADFEIYAEEV